MNHLFCLILPILSIWALPLYAQSVTQGCVQDEKGNPISFASVYIKELKKGISANDHGEFEVRVAAGTYTFVFQSLGYEMLTREIALPQKTPLVIVMQEKSYEMRMVTISVKDEDPAYRIMRHAIAMAPYYRNIVKEYTSDVYLKTNIHVEQVKGLIALAIDKKQRETLQNLSIVQESMNEIKFFAPDRYEQKIKSIISGTTVDLSALGINTDEMKIGMARLNIYGTDPALPLASGAFSNYKFVYEGNMMAGDFLVNKIKVIPRRKDSRLLSGYIYIVNHSWNIYSLDLTQTTIFGTIRMQQSYGDVGNNIFLPVSYNAELNISAMGVKGSGNLISSVTYLSVVPNNKMLSTAVTPAITEATTAKPGPERTTKLGRKKEKLQNEINSLSQKTDLNNREMQKMARLQMRAVELATKEERLEKGEKRSLEIKSNYEIATDSLATKYDTTYWNRVRPVPLGTSEVATYQKYDSIAAVVTGKDSLKPKQNASMIAMGILAGNSYRIDSSLRIHFGGLIGLSVLNFNTVDGYVYGLSGGLSKRFKNETRLDVEADGAWAFSRACFLWHTSLRHTYNNKLRASWNIESGMLTTDFAGTQGAGMLNTWSSLFFRTNYSTFYGNHFVKLNHQIDVINGLVLYTGFEWSKRSELQNNSNFSLFYRDSRNYRPNIPRHAEVAAHPELLADNRAAVLDLRLQYTPERYYEIYKGRKYYRHSNYPTFTLQWKKGLKNIFESDSDFDFVSLNISQSISYGYFNRFTYTVSSGKFFNTGKLSFADFKHFYANESAISLNRDFGTPYQLLPYYTHSTNKWYAAAFVHYFSPYILVKRIPFLQNMLFGENLYASYLQQPQLQHYVELGYGITLTDMLGFGAFVSFEKAQYRSWGLRFSLNMAALSEW